MLDNFMLEAIRDLSRTTKIESLISLLLKIIQHNFVFQKSILILEQKYFERGSQENSVLAAIQDCQEQRNSSNRDIAFHRFAINDRNSLAPLSLLKDCRRQPQAQIVNNLQANNLSDVYLTEHQPNNFAYFPLLEGEKFFGILYLEDFQQPLDLAVQQQISILTVQAAIAIKNIYQYHQQELRIRQLETLEETTFDRDLLAKIIDLISSHQDLQTMFEVTARMIGTKLEVSRCQIHNYIAASELRTPVSAVYQKSYPAHNNRGDYSNAEFSIMSNPHMKKILDRDPAIVINDVYQSPFKRASYILQELKIKSVLAIRTSYQGQANGLIMLHQCDRFRTWTDREIKTIEAIATQIGFAIAYIHLSEQDKRQRRALNRQNKLLQQEIEVRKKTEIALQHSEELYRSIFEQVAIGIVQKQYKTGKITHVNRKFCEITGFSAAELYQKTVADITHPEDIAQTKMSIEQVEKEELAHCTIEKR